MWNSDDVLTVPYCAAPSIHRLARHVHHQCCTRNLLLCAEVCSLFECETFRSMALTSLHAYLHIQILILCWPSHMWLGSGSNFSIRDFPWCHMWLHVHTPLMNWIRTMISGVTHWPSMFLDQLISCFARWGVEINNLNHHPPLSFMVRDTIHDDIDISSMWRVSSSQRLRKHYQICCKGCRPQKTVQSSYLHGKCCKFGYFFRHLSFVRVILSIAAVARGPSKLQNDTHKTRIHSMKLYFNRNR